jgi:hypothetical protein
LFFQKIKTEVKSEDQNETRARRPRFEQETQVDHGHVAPSIKRARRSKVKTEEETVEEVKSTKRSARKRKEASSPDVKSAPLARTKQTRRTTKPSNKKETKKTVVNKTVSKQGEYFDPFLQA